MNTTLKRILVTVGLLAGLCDGSLAKVQSGL